MTDLLSVIVTTYNRPDALDAVLRSLAHQTDGQFEIVVAEDGSQQQTAEAVGRWAKSLLVPLKHVWHEHRGFRGGEIRNRGIRSSSGALCIFLDGDCLVRPDFVATHRTLAQPGWFVTGNRILLSRELTDTVLTNRVPIETWGFGSLVKERVKGGINRLLPALSLPLGPVRKLNSARWEGAQTCNLAVARADIDRIDGFDCSYTGWGLEDSDLVVRLLRAGLRRKDGRFATGVLHLWHPGADRSRLRENERRLAEVLSSDRIRARRGLSTMQETNTRDGIPS